MCLTTERITFYMRKLYIPANLNHSTCRKRKQEFAGFWHTLQDNVINRVHNCLCSNCSVCVYHLDIPSFTFAFEIVSYARVQWYYANNCYVIIHSCCRLLARLGFWANRHRLTQSRTTCALMAYLEWFACYASDLFEVKERSGTPGQAYVFRDNPGKSGTVGNYDYSTHKPSTSLVNIPSSLQNLGGR